MSGLAIAESWQDQQLLSLATDLSEDQQLQSWQKQALKRFLQHGFPTRRDESWRHTRLDQLARQPFTLRRAELIEKIAPRSSASQVYSVDVDYVNGQMHIDALDLPEGVIIADLRTACQQPDIKALLTTKLEKTSVFESLNAALLTGGLYIYIPTEVCLDKPIHLHYNQGDIAHAWMSHPRHLVVADRHSQCTIIEEYSGVNQTTYFNNVVTQLQLEIGAKVTYIKYQAEQPQAFHIANTVISQARDSHIRCFHFGCGGRMSRDNIHLALQGVGAASELYGLTLASGNSHIDFHTNIAHVCAQTTSQQHYKGIISDKAHGVFHGKITVHPDAQQIQAAQYNKNILLADTAEIDTQPQLEINADNVKCAHGATVGQLDEQAIFFLRARGIPLLTARDILTQAFAADIIAKLPTQPWSSALQAKISEAVSTMHQLEASSNE